MSDKNGLIVINKEAGMTSQTVVNRVKRLLGVEKAGHTGTLDPMATGVLPVMVGRGVKAGEYLLSSDKHYIAHLLLGVTTDTEDTTGTVLSECSDLPDESAVRAVCASFVGLYEQIPPMYSALKIGGKKLCDLARSGQTVDREARTVTVFSLGVTKLSAREYELDVVCSKGTYIRTLCADIGQKLGCGGVMSMLCRAEAAGFTLADAVTLAELEALPEENRTARIVPIEDLFSDLYRVVLSDFFARLGRAGCVLYLKKLGLVFDAGTRVRLCDAKGFFALGEVILQEDGAVIKPIKQFDIG